MHQYLPLTPHVSASHMHTQRPRIVRPHPWPLQTRLPRVMVIAHVLLRCVGGDRKSYTE